MLRRVGLILTTAILLLAVSANIALASGVPISESPDYPGCVLVEHPGAQYGKVKAIVQRSDQLDSHDGSFVSLRTPSACRFKWEKASTR